MAPHWRLLRSPSKKETRDQERLDVLRFSVMVRVSERVRGARFMAVRVQNMGSRSSWYLVMLFCASRSCKITFPSSCDWFARFYERHNHHPVSRIYLLLPHSTCTTKDERLPSLLKRSRSLRLTCAPDEGHARATLLGHPLTWRRYARLLCSLIHSGSALCNLQATYGRRVCFSTR